MEVKVNICGIGREASCAISIKDISTDFLPEDSTTPVFQKFKKSEVKNIDIIKHNKVSGTETVKTIVSDIGTSNIVELDVDGWFVISHIILPTKEWFDSAKEQGGVFYNYDTIYYVDNERYYKYKGGDLTEVSIDEILERNPINTTISLISQNFFSTFYLMHCYIWYANKLLSLRLRCDKLENLSIQEYKFARDTIWATVNIIKYLVELEDFEGAAVRLNELDTCNGLCKNLKNKLLNTTGCGCGG